LTKSRIIVIIESVTIKFALASLRRACLVIAALGTIATAAIADAAAPTFPSATTTHARFTEPPFISLPMREMAPVFPALGLMAAIWATHHVRRRNARLLALSK
jgi:hypothetical protein